MTGPGEFGGEGPDRPGPGHAVRPADASLVVPQPAQVTVQPAGPHAGPVAVHAIDRKPCRPLPDHEREVDAGMHGIVDRPGQPRIDLHQQRAAVRVTPEFHLADALHADRRGQADGRAVDIRWDLDALPHHRGAPQGRARPVGHVSATGQDFAVDDEQRRSLAATAGEFLSEDAQTAVEESLGRVGGLTFVDHLDGHQAIAELLRPRDGGLEDEGELEGREHGGQVVDAVDAHGLRLVDAQLARDLQRAVLVQGYLERGVRGQRQHAPELGELLPGRHQGRDDAVARRKDDPGRVVTDELNDRVRERGGVGCVAGQDKIVSRIARLEGQHGKRRIAFHEALA
jgi:hypothetical protein